MKTYNLANEITQKTFQLNLDQQLNPEKEELLFRHGRRTRKLTR